MVAYTSLDLGARCALSTLVHSSFIHLSLQPLVLGLISLVRRLYFPFLLGSVFFCNFIFDLSSLSFITSALIHGFGFLVSCSPVSLWKCHWWQTWCLPRGFGIYQVMIKFTCKNLNTQLLTHITIINVKGYSKQFMTDTKRILPHLLNPWYFEFVRNLTPCKVVLSPNSWSRILKLLLSIYPAVSLHSSDAINSSVLGAFELEHVFRCPLGGEVLFHGSMRH